MSLRLYAYCPFLFYFEMTTDIQNSYKEQLAKLNQERKELEDLMDPYMKQLWDLSKKKDEIQRKMAFACDEFYPRDELELHRALSFFQNFAKEAKGCILLEPRKPSGDKKFEFQVTSNFSIDDWGNPELNVQLVIITQKRIRLLHILNDMIKSKPSWEGYWTFSPYGYPLELNSYLSKEDYDKAISELN